ncbi:MAG: hypothetical protein ACOVLC_02325 [Flavobacterium sp.]
MLFVEQKGFCAYTEEYIGRADAKDIEHINPTLKGTEYDGYPNWYLVKHQWNKEKSSKWEKFQPVLHPSDASFENRILYDKGDYRVADSDDKEAVNLISLLNLDDIILADERKKYISRKKIEIAIFGLSEEDFFKTLIEDDLCQIKYIRAIQEEFKIELWNLIPTPK